MRLPTFLLIGAARSGTTTLYEYLKQHPQIFMSPIKSPKYFAYDEDTPGLREWGAVGSSEDIPVKTFEEYQQLFRGVKDESQIGEASLYIESAHAPNRIKNELGDVKILAILRNPIDRAYSAYRMRLRTGSVKPDVYEAFKNPTEEHWVQVGFYYRLLKRYFDIFPRHNIKVIIFERFIKDRVKAMQEIYRFLGVDDSFSPDTSIIYAKGGTPKKGPLNAIIRKSGKALKGIMPGLFGSRSLRKPRVKIRDSNIQKYPPLPQDLYEKLRLVYKDDIENLERLLSEEIPEWH
jgi:hypothetical protein